MQYLLPASIGIMDVLPSLRKKNYVETAKKALIICGLILLQNRGTMALKNSQINLALMGIISNLFLLVI